MNALEYIEATYIEEIGSQYQNEGYQVMVSPLELGEPFETRPVGYALMATKCCRKVAFAMIERGKLSQESDRLEKLREQADKDGFYDFFLTMLSPPPHTDAEVSGLGQELFDYLVVNPLDHLAELPAKVRPLSVGQIGFDSLSVSHLGIKAMGNGVVEVELEDGQLGNAARRAFGFPLNFDVELDHALRLKEVYEMTADTEGFYNARASFTGEEA